VTRAPAGGGPGSLLRAAVTAWALAGGGLLVAVIAVNVLSVLGGAVLGRPFPGDFEITETGVAVAVFAFLPWCQLTGANVTADVFTSRTGPRLRAALGLAASATALAFSALLVWRMWFGLLDQKAYGYTTAILQFPHWIAFAAILASLVLLAAASAATLVRDARDMASAGAR
jgi:TRAP-type C4-dicarboxylate transport system permease small subunit